MIRMLLTHALLFLIPFIGYAIWLYIGKKAEENAHFRDGPIAWLAICGLFLVVVSFSSLAIWGKAPQGSQYRPAQIVDGELVRGGYNK
ncbi:DUF6111 family protein [Flexibacterium corallicola]|uniref:DUF6111 family protein n=1 Tax=Flexibacterium corallicola TaxID=3037259 RepID=UPI00286F92BB|nr:DUF6111 family protein [Pseudovibrio sp. M1P-2-3]